MDINDQTKNIEEVVETTEPVTEPTSDEPAELTTPPTTSDETTEILDDPETTSNDSGNETIVGETPAEEIVPNEQAEAAEQPVTPVPAPKNDNPNARWYVVHTYSGHENKVAVTLKQRVESEHLQAKILEVLVPTQDKIEIKSGKKVTVKEKIFPGYILVKLILDDVSWLAVRTTQGVTGFVGIGNKPTPISEAEVATIVSFAQTEAPVYKQVFEVNDTVKIVDGPFSDFIGKIDNVDKERGKVKVLVSIFGRETPVELDFLQVQKI